MEIEDRRKHFRLSAEQTVQLTVLAETEVSLVGRIMNVSGRGMQLLAPCALEPGSRIQIEFGTSVYFGEIRHCRAEGQDFIVGIELERPVTSAGDLIGVLR